MQLESLFETSIDRLAEHRDIGASKIRFRGGSRMYGLSPRGRRNRPAARSPLADRSAYDAPSLRSSRRRGWLEV